MTEVLKRWGMYIAAAILLLVLAGTCVNSAGKTIAGEQNVYDKQLKNRVEILVIAKNKTDKVVDSLKYENQKKDKEIANLKKEKAITNKKIADLEKDKQNTLVKVASNTYKQSAEFIGKTYNDKKAVTYTDKGVDLTGTVPNKVVATIVEKEFLEKKLVLTEKNVSDTEKEVAALEGKVKNKDTEIESLNTLSKEKDLTLEASKNLSEATKKENKNLKTGRFINRILIVAAFVGGILVAK